MADMNEDEEILASGEVPTLGVEGSANEEEDQEEDPEDITSADNIRQARAVVTARANALPDNTNLPRTRLT